jgi:hypothetical protein
MTLTKDVTPSNHCSAAGAAAMVSGSVDVMRQFDADADGAERQCRGRTSHYGDVESEMGSVSSISGKQ